jgi:hypothetical protein
MGRTRSPRSSSGLTFVEMMVALTLSSAVFSALYVVALGMRTYFDQANVRAALEEEGRRTLRTMIAELRQTGIVEGGPVNHPAVYARPLAPMDEHNVRGDLIATLSLRDADLGGQVFDPSRGSRADQYRNRPSTELVFRHLAVRRISSANQNLRPILDATTGAIRWGEDEYSYHAVVGPSGVPQLERRVNGESPRVLGRYVRKVIFEAISHDPTVLYNQIVIVLYLARRVGGRLVTVDVEGTVNLRNTKEIE